jgi:hypothetical protein
MNRVQASICTFDKSREVRHGRLAEDGRKSNSLTRSALRRDSLSNSAITSRITVMRSSLGQISSNYQVSGRIRLRPLS